MFGLGRSTVSEIVVETCHEIATHLLTEFVKIPSGDKLRRLWMALKHSASLPELSWITYPIIRPEESGSDYYTEKGTILFLHRRQITEAYSGCDY